MHRYGVLHSIIILMLFASWLSLLASIGTLIAGVVIFSNAHETYQGVWRTTDSLAAAQGTMLGIAGFFMLVVSFIGIVVAEAAKVFMDIEANTRQTVALLNEAKSRERTQRSSLAPAS